MNKQLVNSPNKHYMYYCKKLQTELKIDNIQASLGLKQNGTAVSI